MRLDAMLKKTDQALISCEFFPPKTDKGEVNLWRCLNELQVIQPAYISVTYGAGGSTQERTKRIVLGIKEKTGLSPVAHLTCVGSTQEQLGDLLNDYANAGIENILALRGDAPDGHDTFKAVDGGFSHATDLIEFIHGRGDFSIACATYPEGHPESKGGIADDIRYLKMKQDLGAICAVTQYFFDNELFFRFRDAADKAGVTIPLIPGVMPILNYEQIVRFSNMCGTSISDQVHQKMQPISGDLVAVADMGVDLAVAQCRELLNEGVAGLHFYTLNKSAATIAIVNALGIAQG
ncbi:MAG: methylenetetrahydrofolate reductase [NAD(P)H] [Zetaproteobacteria bacterium]|nr:methylenetetrahydrofolate reductase [NAD(P)H] [Zetaproteobacteria bacterium]